MTRLHALAGLVVFSFAGSLAQGTQAWADSRPFVDGSPEGMAILEFLNDPATTPDLLIEEVGLDAQVARSLMDHRDGADDVSGTSDDNRFETIAELDSTRWMGLCALEQLHAYLERAERIPRGNDFLGVYEGVRFTVREADAVLRFVNWSSAAALDEALNIRAVNSILEARPIDSVEQLAGLYYVGASALARLKELASGASS